MMIISVQSTDANMLLWVIVQYSTAAAAPNDGPRGAGVLAWILSNLPSKQ